MFKFLVSSLSEESPVSRRECLFLDLVVVAGALSMWALVAVFLPPPG